MVKLHLGCGKRDFGKDWDHIDMVDLPHIKSHDVTKLPYKSNSVDVIYACHLIAYFDREEIIPILKEWRRVLKTDGILRIATPDLKPMIKLYRSGMDITTFLGPMYGKMNGVYHKTCYDYYSLVGLLSFIGFRRIRKYNRYATEHAAFDDHSAAFIEGKLISLNVQCYA